MEAAQLEGTISGYRAALTDEGLVVYDVPIFAACAFDAGKEVVNFDAKWVKRAFKTAVYKQRVENYKPPMHIRHHDKESAANDTVRKAGYFKHRRIGTIRLDGKVLPGIYADLVFTDPSAQWEVRTNQLNYRSVEIFDYRDAPIINGLALLDHEAPHLELPMLQIEGPVEDLRTPDGVANANFQAPAPAVRAQMVCFRRTGSKAFVTFKDESMKTPEQIAEEAEAAEAARIANLGGTEVGTATANLSSDGDDDDANLSDDSDGDDDANLEGDDGEGGGDGIDWEAVAKALESGEIMAKDLELVTAALAGGGAAPEEETVMTEVEPEPPVQAAAGMKKASPELIAMAKMQGEMDAMKAGNARRDASSKRVSEVASALTRLKGLPLGADLNGKLVKFHKKHGGAAFGDYVESLAQNTAIEPGDREDRTTAAFKALGGRVPAVAMKYQTDGVESVEAAANFSREYKQLQESGARMSTDEETYVKNNMEREARRVAAS